MRLWGSPTVLAGVLVVAFAGGALAAATPADSNPADRQTLVNGDSNPKKVLVLNPKTMESRYRLAAGVSYTGAQLRYHFTPRWAGEFRYQVGKANSDYGKVKSEVQGLRAYRFIPYRRNLSWYLGAEAAHADAHADNSSYQTDGFALGAFGGMEYRILPRLAIGMDIGPYAISLREKQTHMSQSSLDFVVNTAINFCIF